MSAKVRDMRRSFILSLIIMGCERGNDINSLYWDVRGSVILPLVQYWDM